MSVKSAPKTICGVKITEELILSTILNKKNSRKKLLIQLSPEYFLNKANRAIFEISKREYNVNNNFNALEVSTKYSACIEALEMPLIMKNLLHSSEYHISSKVNYESLYIMFKEYALQTMYKKLLDELTTNTENALNVKFLENKVKRMVKLMTLINMEQDDNKKPFITLSGIIEEIKNNNYQRKTPPFVQSGNKALDKLFGGGIPFGQIMVVAAASGVGKTTLCLTIAKSIISRIKNENLKEKVFFLSLDMADETLQRYLLSIMFDITEEKINTYNFSQSEKEEMNSFLDYCAICNNDPAVMGCSKDLSDVDTLCTTITNINDENEAKVKYLIVDYIQLTRDTSEKFSTKTMEIESVIKKIQQFASENGITVILISQLNKNSDRNKAAIASDMSDSAAIERFASLIISLYKPNKGCLEVSIIKTRHGQIPEKNLSILLNNYTRSMW